MIQPNASRPPIKTVRDRLVPSIRNVGAGVDGVRPHYGPIAAQSDDVIATSENNLVAPVPVQVKERWRNINGISSRRIGETVQPRAIKLERVQKPVATRVTIRHDNFQVG